MNARLKSWLVLGGATAAIGVAVFVVVAQARHFRRHGEDGAQVWFYDQRAHHLYAAPRDLIPPDGNTDNRVRAMAIGFQGLGNQPSQLKIAYLEKYSPELKSLLERAQAAHAARLLFTEKMPSPNSAYFQDNTFVKSADEADWHTVGSDEGHQLTTAWREWRGPAGQRPIISVPSAD